MPGKKMNSIKNKKVYEAVKEDAIKDGMSEQEAKRKAAKIANSQSSRKKK